MWGNNSTPPCSSVRKFWIFPLAAVCGASVWSDEKGGEGHHYFYHFYSMMSPIASAPFFTFNFSRFQEAFLRVYLYFILERLIFTFKVPLVTEIFYYQRLCEERAHFYLAISHQTKIITISNTPTMMKERRLRCRRRPIFCVPSTANQRQHPYRP